MDATQIITELLHDPTSINIGDIIKIIYVEPMGLCDDVEMPIGSTCTVRDLWHNYAYIIDYQTRKRFNYAAIVRNARSDSKVIDLRDVVSVDNAGLALRLR